MLPPRSASVFAAVIFVTSIAVAPVVVVVTVVATVEIDTEIAVRQFWRVLRCWGWKANWKSFRVDEQLLVLMLTKQTTETRFDVCRMMK